MIIIRDIILVAFGGVLYLLLSKLYSIIECSKFNQSSFKNALVNNNSFRQILSGLFLTSLWTIGALTVILLSYVVLLKIN